MRRKVLETNPIVNRKSMNPKFRFFGCEESKKV